MQTCPTDTIAYNIKLSTPAWNLKFSHLQPRNVSWSAIWVLMASAVRTKLTGQHINIHPSLFAESADKIENTSKLQKQRWIFYKNLQNDKHKSMKELFSELSKRTLVCNAGPHGYPVSKRPSGRRQPQRARTAMRGLTAANFSPRTFAY